MHMTWEYFRIRVIDSRNYSSVRFSIRHLNMKLDPQGGIWVSFGALMTPPKPNNGFALGRGTCLALGRSDLFLGSPARPASRCPSPLAGLGHFQISLTKHRPPTSCLPPPGETTFPPAPPCRGGYRPERDSESL